MSFLKAKSGGSSNTNNDLITSTYTDSMNQGTGATNILSALLTGQGDTEAAQAGYDSYLKNAGYESALSNMVRGVTGGQAAKGLLRSGSTGTAYLTKGTELNQQYYNNYLQNLTGLSNLGTQAGSLVAQTGQQSTSGGASTAGTIASLIGGIGSIFSDRRLKTDIKRVGKTKSGLDVFTFRYKDGGPVQMGVMAQDVEKKKPSALGPKIEGYRTVDYGRL